MKYYVIIQGKTVEVEQLPNGKFKKPNISQFTKNALGSVYIDNCRIPTREENQDRGEKITSNCYGKIDVKTKENAYPKELGRFPANLIVSNDILNNGIVTKNTYIKSTYQQNRSGEFLDGLGHSGEQGYEDSGQFSRYFSLDSWSSEKLKQLPPEIRKTFPFMIVPKSSTYERELGCDKLQPKVVECLEGNKDGTLNKRTNHQPTIRKNVHPTTKPITLMAYLITLGSCEGQIILDPFVGSGTTCLASEMLHRKWIGIEREPEYVEIAKHRIKYMEQHTEPSLTQLFGKTEQTKQ